MTIKAILFVSFAANFLFCQDQSLYLYNLCFQPFAQEPDFWWTNLSEHQFVYTDGYKRMSLGSGLNKRLKMLYGGEVTIRLHHWLPLQLGWHLLFSDIHNTNSSAVLNELSITFDNATV